MLGLSFKAETDDVRDSPSLTVVSELLSEGVRIRAHDPQGSDNFRKLIPETQCLKTSYEALEGADAMILMTDGNFNYGLDPVIGAKELPFQHPQGERFHTAPHVVQSAYTF